MLVATHDPDHCGSTDCIRGGLDLSLYSVVFADGDPLDERCPCGCIVCKETSDRQFLASLGKLGSD